MMLDIFIIVLLVWALISGWRAGFLKEVVSTVGMGVGLLVAATCYSQFSHVLAVDGSESNMMTSVLAFLILWIIVPIVLGLVATLLTKALKGLCLGLPNSLLGAAVSVLKYAVLMSCVLNVMQFLHIMNAERTADSKLFAPVAGLVSGLVNHGQTDGEATDADSASADTLWVRRTANDSLMDNEKLDR